MPIVSLGSTPFHPYRPSNNHAIIIGPDSIPDHLTLPVTNQSYPSFPAYFQITSPSQGTQLQNGAANKVTWVKGLLDDVNAFDVEMSRLSVDGLILVARDGKHCPCLFSLFHSPNITFPVPPLIPSRLRLSCLSLFSLDTIPLQIHLMSTTSTTNLTY